MSVVEKLGLREDPFGPANAVTGFGVAPPMIATFEKLLAAVRRADPLTVLVGRPGMGKTLLLGMLEAACRADRLDVRTVARGDMAHTALGSGAQVLVIDEADTINTATLTALAPGGLNAAAPAMVFAVVQPALHRLSADVRTTVIEIRPFTPAESEHFLLARAAAAGRPSLFAPEALNIIVEAARGSPRLLRVLAGAAMFQAMGDSATRIEAAHASLAAAMHGSLLSRLPVEPDLPPAANDTEPRVDEAVGNPLPKVAGGARRHATARSRVGVLSFAASVALAALVFPVFLAPEPAETTLGVPSANASQAVAGPVQLAAAAFTVAPANAALPLRPGLTSTYAAAGRPTLMREPVMISARAPVILAAATTGAGVTGLPTPAFVPPRVELPPAAVIRPTVMGGGDRAALIDLIGATRPRLAIASRGNGSGDRFKDGEQMAASFVAPTAIADPTPTPMIMPVASFPAPLLIAAPAVSVVAAPPTIDATRATIQTAEAARTFASEAAAAKQAADTAKSTKAAADGAKQAAEEAAAVKITAQQSKDASEQAEAAKLAAEQAKAVRDSAKQADGAKESADQARIAKLAAEQAKAAKEAAKQADAAKEAAAQAKAAKDAAEQAKATKDAAEQAKAAKEAAEQAQAAKAAAEQAKAAKEAADQAKAAKDAAEQAQAAKDAAEQAKAAKEAADQAKAAKDAAEQAKAAKEAADQAKAVKEAADQAKAAKDAAEQAKAAKEAADQAKAAKDAAEQAKAAKEAADQAKAAKDAAEQAQAAKDAAEQAKAAKDAADQAKAAKDAVDQAKAAKDAADQAKAAKEAADQAKAAKDAAQAAKDAAKAAKEAAKRN